MKARAGRVLLISDDGRVLLVGSSNPELSDPTVWVPPGGGVEPGETTRQAARRELLEEVGLEVELDDLVGPIGRCEGPDRTVDYFVLVVEDTFPPVGDNPDAAELAVWVGFRWWSIDDLAATKDIVWPLELGAVLKNRRNLVTDEPWEFAWHRS